MADNQITAVSKEAIERMTNLHTLVLNRNALTSFPQLHSESLRMLSIIGCGLSRQDIDMSGLPNLAPNYLFVTQEEYDTVLGPNWK